MRITQSMLSRIGIEQLAAQRNRLARTQEQAATGLRLNRPSDDPIDYRSTLALKDSLGQTGQFLRAIDRSRIRLRTSEDAIAETASLISEAKTVALAASSSNYSGSLDELRIQVESLFDRVVALSNTRSADGGYVFSGLASDSPAFVAAGSFTSGTPPTVTFNGDNTAIEVEIDEGVTIEVTRDGEQVFQGPVDIFGVLGQLWSAIDAADPVAAGNAIDGLDVAFDHLNLERAYVGSEEKKAESFEDRLQLQEQDQLNRISLLEDADAFEVYSDLAAQEAALQASLSVTGRLLTPTLLDFI